MPSPLLFSFPTMPMALYFATSKSAGSSAHSLLSSQSIPERVHMLSTGSQMSKVTSVASPFRWLPDTGAPDASTSMHFSSPVKMFDTGGTRPGSVPASLHSKKGGLLSHGRSVGSTSRPADT